MLKDKQDLLEVAFRGPELLQNWTIGADSVESESLRRKSATYSCCLLGRDRFHKYLRILCDPATLQNDPAQHYGVFYLHQETKKM